MNLPYVLWKWQPRIQEIGAQRGGTVSVRSEGKAQSRSNSYESLRTERAARVPYLQEKGFNGI